MKIHIQKKKNQLVCLNESSFRSCVNFFPALSSKKMADRFTLASRVVCVSVLVLIKLLHLMFNNGCQELSPAPQDLKQ